MSGHSKWSTIKHKKAASDAKRGKTFSKLAREIMVAARAGGGDPSGNITLRSLIQKARSYNMPADNIDRAIKKGTGDLDGMVLEEMMYEGYATGGVAVIVQVLTDNRNRSAAEVRHLFNKFGASMASQGSVSRGFERRGQIRVNGRPEDEDRILEIALEAGADDLEAEEDGFTISSSPSAYQAVLEACEAAHLDVASSEITLVPETYMPMTDTEQASAVLRFIEALDDLDDVQYVYTNMDIDDTLIEKLNAPQ